MKIKYNYMSKKSLIANHNLIKRVYNLLEDGTPRNKKEIALEVGYKKELIEKVVLLLLYLGLIYPTKSNGNKKYHRYNVKLEGDKVGELKHQFQEKYKTNCVICGKLFVTMKNTANEGICYKCRCI